MEVRTVTSEIPEHIKPLLANAEAVKEAIHGPKKKKKYKPGYRTTKDRKRRKLNKGRASKAKGADEEGKEKRQRGKVYAGAYAKPQPRRNSQMGPIPERGTWKREEQNIIDQMGET